MRADARVPSVEDMTTAPVAIVTGAAMGLGAAFARGLAAEDAKVMLCDVNDADEMARGEEFMHRLVERALSMGGTCTGEHGIGQGKQKYLKGELGGEAIDAMRAIKQALDPQNIFNPGKIIPALSG